VQCKLIECYGARLFFADVHGHKNVICWRDMASFFINEKWYSNRRDNIKDDARRVVIAAAKLIRAETRQTDSFKTDCYLTPDILRDSDKLKA
jgi:hypothetical protein